MLKLIKYEFRKNRAGILAMLLIAATLFLLSPLGKALKKPTLMYVSTFALLFYAFAVYAYVLIRGIIAYSGEISSKTGYLLMMVPRSTASILFSKLVFTLFFAIVMLAAAGACLAGSATLLFAELQGLTNILEVIRAMLEHMDINLTGIINALLLGAAEVLGSVLAVVSIGYLAATLSATVLESGKLRGLVSVVFFALLFALLLWLTDLITPALDNYEAFDTFQHALSAGLPALLLDLGFTAAFTLLSAQLLKHKVCL